MTVVATGYGIPRRKLGTVSVIGPGREKWETRFALPLI